MSIGKVVNADPDSAIAARGALYAEWESKKRKMGGTQRRLSFS
jgi:hypothetical protein